MGAAAQDVTQRNQYFTGRDEESLPLRQAPPCLPSITEQMRSGRRRPEVERYRMIAGHLDYLTESANG